MSFVFIKQGNYDLNISIDTMGSVGELYNDQFFQFSKLSAPFKLNFHDGVFGLFDLRVGETASFTKKFRIQEAISYLESFDVVLFGKISKKNEFHTNTNIVSESTFYVFDKKTNQFIDIKTGAHHEEKNIFSLIYFSKISTTNAYSMILNSFVNLETSGYAAIPDQFYHSDLNFFVSDNGNSIRSKLVKLTYSSNVTELASEKGIGINILHLKDNSEAKIKFFNQDLINENEEFIKGFKFHVTSNLKFDLSKDEITFTKSKESFGYLKIFIESSPIYNKITEGNFFEKLEYLFNIF